MILAAGFGTRLGPLTRLRPKPMLPICGAPLVRWAVWWLRHHGIREVVVNLHHMGEQIEAELGDGRDLDVSISYSHEAGMILGTGGGLRHARHLLEQDADTPIVVVNGKIMLDLDLAAVLARHAETGAEATMVLRPDPAASRWGSLRLAPDGRVGELLQARPEHGPPAPEPLGPPLMFTGVHVFQPRFLDRIPPEGEQCVVRTAYRELFHEGQGLFGYETRDYWWEHSTVERYLQGVRNVLAGRAALAHAQVSLRGVDASAALDPTAQVTGPVWIGPGAKVGAGAKVGPDVQVGAGAALAGGVTVRRAVVWPGCVVEQDVSDAVVTPAGIVRAGDRAVGSATGQA